MAKKIRQTESRACICGVLSEKALSIVHGKIKDSDVACDIVRGTLSIETDIGTYRVRVYSQSKKSNGEKNNMYDGIETIAKEYVSKAECATGKITYKTGKAEVKDDNLEKVEVETNVTEPTLCKATVNLSCNDYVGKDGKVKSGLQISLNKANRVTGEEMSAEGVIEGYIKSIKPETVGEDADETGRLIVEIIGVDYNENAQPFTLYVNEDMADDFEGNYEEGQTASLDIELAMRHVGGAQPTQKAFGRAAKVATGFDILEMQVIGGDTAYSEDDDVEDDAGNVISKCFTKAEIKEIMNNRKIMLESLENKGKKEEKKSGLKGRKAKVETETDDDDPF